MRLEPDGERFTIDARDLAELFELDPERVREMMRAGEIRSRVERGEGEDAGRFRLTFIHRERRVQLVVAADGTVLQRSRTRISPGGSGWRGGSPDDGGPTR
jgi:hypothetical protein